MINASTGCMLRDNATGEMLPIVGLEFDGGGAVSHITTLEDGKHNHQDALILEGECTIELIGCRRLNEDELDELIKEYEA